MGTTNIFIALPEVQARELPSISVCIMHGF